MVIFWLLVVHKENSQGHNLPCFKLFGLYTVIILFLEKRTPEPEKRKKKNKTKLIPKQKKRQGVKLKIIPFYIGT